MQVAYGLNKFGKFLKDLQKRRLLLVGKCIYMVHTGSEAQQVQENPIVVMGGGHLYQVERNLLIRGSWLYDWASGDCFLRFTNTTYRFRIQSW